MDDILEETVPQEELKKFERQYCAELDTGKISKEVQYNYTWCLVRSKYAADIRKGIILLEDLYNKYPDNSDRRDYLYYLSIGYARIKKYTKALEYCRLFLQIEPMNVQVQSLEKVIEKKISRDGTIGVALTAAGALVVASLVCIAVKLSKSK